MEYIVKLLTQKGMIEIVTTPETLEQAEKEIKEQYGDFITISANPKPLPLNNIDLNKVNLLNLIK